MTRVTMRKPEEGGIGLKAGDPPEGEQFPLIAKIVNGGAASHVPEQVLVSVGNRILGVNGTSMKGKTGSDVHAAVRAVPAGGDITFDLKHINECDPDPGVVCLTVVVRKIGQMVGLQARDSKKIKDYPSIIKIGNGTPAHESPDIDLGDKIKHINGTFVQGHTKAYVHETIRAIPEDNDIVFGIIKKGTKREKLFEDKEFKESGGAFNKPRGQEVKFASFSGRPDVEVDKPAPAFKEKSDGFSAPRKGSVYGGFDDDDDEEDNDDEEGFQTKSNAFGAAREQGSIYGGFEDDVFDDSDDEEEFDHFDIAEGEEDIA